MPDILPTHTPALPDGRFCSSEATSSRGVTPQGLSEGKKKRVGITKHTIGLILLLGVVLMWTAANFLSSSIFANDSYAKPFFVTYLNSSAFIFLMIPTLLKEIYLRHKAGTLRATSKQIFSLKTLRSFWTHEDCTIMGREDSHETQPFIDPHITPFIMSSETPAEPYTTDLIQAEQPPEYLGLIPTARFSLIFCVLWFGANYFNIACLQYTTVASSTIISSTASVWTLLIGALTGAEKFTWRKLCGVLASIGGIVLISRVDLSAPTTGESTLDSSPARLILRILNDVPDKAVGEVALGDALALLGAIIYGFYTINLKQASVKALPSELNMPLFFSLVGFFNIFVFLPVIPILHFTSIERFEFPPSGHVWLVLIGISMTSLLSDTMWAYAMIFTSPLVGTVGLSLTIPVSLVGEMIIQSRYENWVYWVGAMVVVGSFVFVEREEVKEEQVTEGQKEERRSLVLEDGLLSSPAGSSERMRSSVEAGNDLLDDSESDDEDDETRDRLQRQANGYTDLER